MVSIPDGLPRPFSRGAEVAYDLENQEFQSQTGFPGHLAYDVKGATIMVKKVSIPDGLPRPFSQ